MLGYESTKHALSGELNPSPHLSLFCPPWKADFQCVTAVRSGLKGGQLDGKSDGSRQEYRIGTCLPDCCVSECRTETIATYGVGAWN